MGCLKKLGCLLVGVALIAVGAAGAWYFLRGNRSSASAVDTTGLTRGGWQTLTPEGALRAKTALERLRAPRSPAYLAVAAGDLAAYILQELSRTLPSSADSVEAA